MMPWRWERHCYTSVLVGSGQYAVKYVAPFRATLWRKVKSEKWTGGNNIA